MLDLIREKIKTAQDKDVEDKKGTQPKRYYAADADGDKMSKKTKEKRAAHFAKNSKKDDDDSSAYKKAPGDAKADTKPSQYTKQYKKMFGEEQYTDLEEGKLVGNTGFIIDTLAGMVKKEVGKEMQKSREKGVVLMNKIARMVGASVSMSHKRPKSDLFIKSSYAFVNDGEPIVQGESVEEELKRGDRSYLEKRIKMLDQLQDKIIRMNDLDREYKQKANKAVGLAKFAVEDLLEESVDEACWDGYTQKGMKKKGDKMVPNCVPVNELNSKQVKQKLQKIKGITKDQLAMLSSMNATVLQTVINQLSTVVMGDDVEEERDYKKEYENYQGKPEQIKRRAARNAARRSLKDNKDIKGKDVHHKDNNPLNNDKKNLSVVTKKFNRTEPRKR
jgi:hypothetical protein